MKGTEEEEVEVENSLISSRIGSVKSLDYSSDSSSSIGAPDDSDEDEENDNSQTVDVSSKGALALDSLEESLPIKRGLSNHFSGKSKSFANLSDMTCTVNRMKEVEKPENPFNKRRRVLMANKLRKSIFYSWSNPKSMPLLAALNEEADDDDQDEKMGARKDHHTSSSSSSSSSKQEQERRFKSTLSFKSQSCFALSDLQEEEEEED